MPGRKGILVAVTAAMVLVLAGVAGYYWYANSWFVSTEDARVDGPVYRVAPQISGRVLEIRKEEGEVVAPGEILARLDDVSLSPTASPDLATVRSPVGGVVIKKLGQVGEVVTAGQPLFMVVDPAGFYVTANVEETKVKRVRPGQRAEVSVDALPGQRFVGRVTEVGLATQATFSLLPSMTSGTFTKVTQRVPVRIEVDGLAAAKPVYGASVAVRVRVR